MKIRFEIETDDPEEIRQISKALAKIKASGKSPRRMNNKKLKTTVTKPGLKKSQPTNADLPKPVPAKVVGTKKKKMPDMAFIELWNSSKNYAAIMKATGQKRSSVSNRATRLRKAGVQMKYFGSPNAGRRSKK